MADVQRVRIVVAGTDATGEEVSLTTQGVLRDVEDGWLIAYTEMNPDDGSAVDTWVLCEGSRVTVTREETMLSTMVFDERETYVGTYQTPVGTFQIRLRASTVDVKRRGAMGRIRLAYQLSLSTPHSPDEEMTTRQLELRFSPCRAES